VRAIDLMEPFRSREIPGFASRQRSIRMTFPSSDGPVAAPAIESVTQ
jgi:hypothetical protein